jgi:hypothetical protein
VPESEKKYVDMSQSKDRVLKATAERYLNLIKFQEWGGASGKTQVAKYVSHDPDLKSVKLSVAHGTGKDRVVKEFDVEVAKLNKVSQARVKQIDTLQKRLDELSAAVDAKGDGTPPGGAGGPEAMARGRKASPQNAPGPEAAAAGPDAPPAGPGTAAPAAAPPADPSASEPDPLGFAELPPVSPPAAGPGPGQGP